ncbi:MAG: DUF1801 domain-containing protein [Myxococcota bacterium]|nr:DUF1801 domain-containing protein [Myxococcota bacterium]
MSENVTQPTGEDVQAFLDSVENPGRREDAALVLRMMREVTGLEPVMWGQSLIGFGTYHYRYDSGREGDFFRVGFSPRKAKLVVYIMPYQDDFEPLLARLGPHKLGKSCLYLGRLSRIDLDVLRKVIQLSWELMAQKYPDS